MYTKTRFAYVIVPVKTFINAVYISVGLLFTATGIYFSCLIQNNNNNRYFLWFGKGKKGISKLAKAISHKNNKKKIQDEWQVDVFLEGTE